MLLFRLCNWNVGRHVNLSLGRLADWQGSFMILRWLMCMLCAPTLGTRSNDDGLGPSVWLSETSGCLTNAAVSQQLVKPQVFLSPSPTQRFVL